MKWVGETRAGKENVSVRGAQGEHTYGVQEGGESATDSGKQQGVAEQEVRRWGN